MYLEIIFRSICTKITTATDGTCFQPGLWSLCRGCLNVLQISQHFDCMVIIKIWVHTNVVSNWYLPKNSAIIFLICFLFHHFEMFLKILFQILCTKITKATDRTCFQPVLWRFGRGCVNFGQISQRWKCLVACRSGLCCMPGVDRSVSCPQTFWRRWFVPWHPQTSVVPPPPWGRPQQFDQASGEVFSPQKGRMVWRHFVKSSTWMGTWRNASKNSSRRPSCPWPSKPQWQGHHWCSLPSVSRF